jgi:hypothetical protein
MRVPTAPFSVIDVPDVIDELDGVAAAILGRHRSQVRELRIEVAVGGVVLRGRAATYYGKQIAQHEVLRFGLAVVANDIVVAARPSAVAPA